MEYNERLHSKLEERKADSAKSIEREIEINDEKIYFAGYSIERVTEEEGILKIEPSEAGSTVFISRETTLPFEIATTNNKLRIANGEYVLEIEDSVEEQERVMRYQRDEGVKEIPVNKSGEYQIEGGMLIVEDNGYKITLSVENTILVIDGFDQERRLKYSETSEHDDDFIVEMKSRKEVNASRRNDVLIELQGIAEEINGDKHGLVKGIIRILNDNDVQVVATA